jgi:mannose-6-phosphate isomerase
VHATGGGILFCEIQQNSDLTYRVYDWGRPGLDGKPRELHLEKALEVIDWGLPEREKAGRAVGARVPGPSGAPPAPSELLLECPKFAMQRITLKSGGVDAADATQCFHILCVIDGTGTIVCPRRDVPSTAIAKGGTYLIPSALQSYHLTTDGTLTAVRAYVP